MATLRTASVRDIKPIPIEHRVVHLHQDTPTQLRRDIARQQRVSLAIRFLAPFVLASIFMVGLYWLLYVLIASTAKIRISVNRPTQ